MKNNILIILINFIGIIGCNSSKNAENKEIKNSDSVMTSTTIVGNDIDDHGCKPSAGYTWSIIKNNCVRIFEVGSQFTASGVNRKSTLAAYLIISQKSDSVEVFLPNIKPFIAVKSTNDNLFENKLNNVIITHDKTFVNIFKENELVFSQDKSEGIGKLLGLD